MALALVPRASGAPADITSIAAPQLGAEAPKAQDIADGDVSTSMQTGQLQYAYPIRVPPGRLGMEPKLALSYSSQAPIYGGIAAGWDLSIPEIRWDGTRGLRGRTRQELPRNYLRYVSDLAGGRPLVDVTAQETPGPGADKAFRAQNDTSFARYERLAAGGSAIWRVLMPDGTKHYFGEASRITGADVNYLLPRAPLTSSVDPWGNTIEYLWSFTANEYRIETIKYTSNPALGLARFAEVRFTYVPAKVCFGATKVGAQEDYRLHYKFVDGASKLTRIDAVALDPGNSDLVQHTRSIYLTYDPSTENCNDGTQTPANGFAPYRQLSSIYELVGGIGAPAVLTPSVSFAYGSPAIGMSQSLPAMSWWDPNAATGMDKNLGWGYRFQGSTWPTAQAMMLDIDGDGRVDRVTTSVASNNKCQLEWQRNFGPGAFQSPSAIELPTLPWKNATGPLVLGTMNTTIGESCALNYQLTRRENPNPPFPSCASDTYLVYRWIDMDGDGLLDLVTAIHHSQNYNPNYPGEAPFGTWPACSGILSACLALDDSCMLGAYDCRPPEDCAVNESILQTCFDSAPITTCERVIAKDNGEGPNCMQQGSPPECWDLPQFPVGGCGQILPHDRCGLYPWQIYKNLGKGVIATTPSFKLQPTPLESYGGNSSMAAGGFAAESHAVQDLDGDGNVDLMVRGRWDLVADPNAPIPYWWTLFLGDGTGGFETSPTTGKHIAKIFTVPQGAFPSLDDSVDIPPDQFVDRDREIWELGQLDDVNGDGLLDYVRNDPPDAAAGVYTYPNTSWGFAHGGPIGIHQGVNQTDIARSLVDTATMDATHQTILTGTRSSLVRRIDLDNDGRSDVYTLDPRAPTTTPVYFNTGGNTTALGVPLGLNMASGLAQQSVLSAVSGSKYVWESRTDVIDLDGDGLPESVSWPSGTMQRYGQNYAGTPPRLLKQVKNGRGLTTEIRYAPLSDIDVVRNDPFFAMAGVASPRTQWVVKSVMTHDDFESSDSETTYRYNDPVFAADDESRYSFRGFKEIISRGPHVNGVIGGKSITERYTYSPDWSGRLAATLVAEASGAVHNIAETTWVEKTLFVGNLIKTYHPSIARSWTCAAGATEVSCKAAPAAFTRADSTWTALTSTTTPGAPLLYVESQTTKQDSEAYNNGDRKTTTGFALHSDASNYRLRDEITISWARVAGADQGYRETQKVWDADHKNLDLEKVALASGVFATTQREYEPCGLVATVRKPIQYTGNGPRTRFTYDAKKLFVILTVNELLHEIETDYNYGTGALIAQRGPNSRQCTQCPTEPLPLKEERKTSIDGLGRPLQVDVTVAYDTTSNTIYKYSTVETFSYVDVAVGAVPTSMKHKQRIEHTENRWTEVKTELDGHGRPTKVIEKVNGTAPADAVTTYDYDIDGKVIAVSVPDPTVNSSAQVTFTYAFDTIGRPTSMRRPDATNPNDRSGLNVSYAGLVETREEVPGIAIGPAAKTQLETDAFGRLVKVREFTTTTVSAETLYAYSAADEVKSIVDPGGVTTELEHDLGGRRTKIKRGTREWIYTYDDNGNVWTEKSPCLTGQEALYTTSFVYDALDRLTSKSLAPRGLSAADRDLFGAETITYDWDASIANRMGRLVFFRTKTTTGTNVFNGRYLYDPEGNVDTDGRTWTLPGLTLPDRIETHVYAAFNKVKTTRPADGNGTEAPTRIDTIYDDRGNPLKLTLIRPGLSNQFAGVQTRNVAGLVTKRRTDQTGPAMTFIESNWAYDKLGRVSSQEVQKGQGATTRVTRQELTYWGSDDPKRLKHWIGPSNLKDFSFTYDKRHQLLGVTTVGNVFSSTFTYGTAGRFNSAIVTPTALPGREARSRNVNYVYSATDPEAVSQLTIASGSGSGTPYATYLYDLAGNQTQRNYFRDASLPPVAVSQQWGFLYDGEDQLRRVTAPNGTIEEYWYDQDGQRALIRTTSGATTTVRWFHHNTEIEFNAAGGIVKTWAYAAMGTPVARIENRNDRTEFRFEGLGSSPIASVESGLGDAAGTSGATNSAFIYSPFGEIIESAGTGTATQRRRFNDKYSDALTGLLYYGKRYADPVAMLWTQSDPKFRFAPDSRLKSPRKSLLYTFDSNNPLRYLDPDGLEFRDHFGACEQEASFLPSVSQSQGDFSPEPNSYWQEASLTMLEFRDYVQNDLDPVVEFTLPLLYPLGPAGLVTGAAMVGDDPADLSVRTGSSGGMPGGPPSSAPRPKLSAKERREANAKTTEQQKHDGRHRGDMTEAHRDQKEGSSLDLTDKEAGIKAAYPDQAAGRTKQRAKEAMKIESTDLETPE